uniref:Uncharacterized protein n=1 Tax=Ditylenchus dipsaci TaxID=166011 RepID=A0A915D716_9BILA
MENDGDCKRLTAALISSFHAAGFMLEELPKKFTFVHRNKLTLFNNQFVEGMPIVPDAKSDLWVFLRTGESYAVMFSGIDIRQHSGALVMAAVTSCGFPAAGTPDLLPMLPMESGMWTIIAALTSSSALVQFFRHRSKKHR